MKKFALLSALVLGLGLTSCDDYVEPNPPAQSNAQESVLQANQVSVASPLAGSTTYDLSTLDATDTPIEVATLTCTSLPEGYTLGAVVEVSANDFAKAFVVPSTVVESEETPGTYTVTVSADDLQGIYYSNISKGPKAKELSFRVLVTTVKGDQTAYVGGPDAYFGPYNATVLPFPSELVLEDNYYLLGTINGWSVATAVKFNHSDASPYDDPVFTLAVDISNDDAASGWWWKIIPESTYVTGDWVDGDYSQYGPELNGDSSLEGTLMPKLNGVEPGAGCLFEAGQMLLTINMEEGTYAFTSAVPYLYTPGDANGWSQTASQMLYTDDYTNYYGYAVLSPNGFKFCDAPDWDHTNYGDAGEEGKLSNDGGAGNLSVPSLGLYWCHVNTGSLTYEVTYISTIGVIGDATPGSWDTSTALTPSPDFLTWSGKVNFGNGEFKFRANNEWDVNLGGDLQNLIQNGSNIASPGEGTYTVTLRLDQLPYSATVTK